MGRISVWLLSTFRCREKGRIIVPCEAYQETQRSTCSALSSLHRLWATRNKILSLTDIYLSSSSDFFFSNFGSQVSSMPSLRNSQISTEDSITDVWAWQPFNRGSCSRASPASGLLAALTESAIRVSSVCRRGFLLPRYLIFSSWIGRMASGEIT